MGILFKSIRAKLIIWFLLVSLIPLIAATIFIYHQSSKALVASNQQSAVQYVTSKAQGIDEWLDRRLAEIELAAKTDIMQSLDLDRINRYLR